MEKVNRYIEYENGDFAVDLFPYKIKNRENFISRDHPVNLNPNSFRYKQYWEDFLKLCLEGKWVNDEGTWVFMMPKLFFYINYVVLSDEERNRINPRLRDNEWIAFTYFLCSEGFSGFEGDDKYTCNKYVGKLQKGEILQKFEQKALDEDPFVKNEFGEYKEYVDPWTYLTETYLITDKRDRPLGQPIYSNGYYNIMMLCARAVGKALKPDEPVLTENGWVKMKDLRIGDKVYGSDGKLCNIVNKTELQKDLDMYKITLRDGRVIEACKDHLWKVWSKNVNRHSESKDVYSTLTTEEMYKSYYTNRIDSPYKRKCGIERTTKEFNYAIPLNKCIEYEKVNLPIDPYFLGLWLGDGSVHRTDITTKDQEVVDYVYKIAKEFNHKVTINYNKDKTTPSYHITTGRNNKDRYFRNLFKDLNLFNNKHIPEIYLRSSEEQRLELLRGLRDSDGTASGGDVSFSNTNKTLIDNVAELARSLGMYVRVKSRQTKLNGVSHKLSYLVVIKTDKKIFNLSRKDGAHKESQPKGKFGTGRFEKTYIVKIEKSGKSDGYCIAVDNEDKTYITKDHIVTHNSFFTFMGHYFHEWLFGGVKRYEDRFKVNNDVLFTLTSPDTKALTRSVSNLQRAYYQMPGQFEFQTNKKDKSIKYYGPFYKNIRGTWQVGASASTVEHVVKKKDNTNAITGSLAQITLMKPTDFKILTGDRFRQAIIEEVGFVKNLKQIFSASKDALRVGKKWVGQLIMLGTSGDMTTIKDAKDMFENPEAYNIFSIPNYWVNKGGEHHKTCGLFLGAYYKSEELKDPQGNTIIFDALFDVVKDRQKNKSVMDSVSFGNDIMWNPIYPKELLRPSHKSPLPIAELSEHRDYILSTDLWKRRSTVGKFNYQNGEVVFKPDLDKELNPILEWGRDSDLEDKTGAWIMYEDAPDFIPVGLYYVLIDPIQQSGEGTSLQSILVYKRKFVGGDQSVQDTIVASYVGRITDGGMVGADKNHEEAIKVARYYNATVFPEMNAIAFGMYVATKNLEKYMEPTPFNVLRAIKGSTLKAHNVSPYKFGIKTNLSMNEWAINRVADWLLTPTDYDSNGIPLRRVYQGIFDVRLLSELINFDFENKGDFDSVSALMLLPYLLADWDDEGVEITEEDEDELFKKYDQQMAYDYVNGGRPIAPINDY
jgi:hypothetical protein